MRPRPALQSQRGDKYEFTIASALAERIHALCQRQGVTLFMTMLAAFKALLAIQSGQRDVPIGILMANRNRLELEGLTGCFINTLVLCADAEKETTFAAYLKRIRETVLAAQAYQEVPFEHLVEVVQAQRNPGCSPLFQVLFDVHRDRILQQPTMGGLTYEQVPEPESPTTSFDLMLGIGERENGFRASFVYCTDLFDQALIARLAQDYVRVLEIVVSQSDATIAQLAAEVAVPVTQGVVEPADESAAQVSQAVQEVLGHTEIDPRASFFTQGGTSLKAVALIQRLNRLWAVNIPLQLIFLHHVVADFSKVATAYARRGE
jgi:non-ribosomal peptide synthetase component F